MQPLMKKHIMSRMISVVMNTVPTLLPKKIWTHKKKLIEILNLSISMKNITITPAIDSIKHFTVYCAHTLRIERVTSILVVARIIIIWGELLCIQRHPKQRQHRHITRTITNWKNKTNFSKNTFTAFYFNFILTEPTFLI